jgi:hypothetical protein
MRYETPAGFRCGRIIFERRAVAFRGSRAGKVYDGGEKRDASEH